MAELKCIVVTPETTVVETTVASVVLPLYDGEIGILAGHAPLIGRLGYGELRLSAPGAATTRLFIDGGFVQVADNTVSVLTNRAIPVQQLDLKEASDKFAEIVATKAGSPELQAIRDEQLLRARTQLRLARSRQGSSGH
ncbi:MAG: ATP synthase F1 subunit epsilon [Pirellulales bacterium]|nr:ATP synthase F1 subunit epsilon [Pirellulales bacterium]